MKKPFIIIGLTGSIGMGKSTTAGLLRKLRVPVYAADDAVHALLGVGGKAVTRVAKIFPQALKTRRGKKYICRTALGSSVFHDAKKMKALEKILHPMVREEEKKFLAAARKAKARVAVLDIPLLFETGGEQRVDAVMVVTASAAIQKQRVMARKNMTAARFKAILKKQMPDKQKRQRADFVIDTGHGRAAVTMQLKAILKGF